MKVERNILEKVKYLLNLDTNEEFEKNFDIFLDAESSEKEANDSKKILVQIIASEVYTKYYTSVREQKDGELLLNSLISVNNNGISDEDFYSLIGLVEAVLYPIIKNEQNQLFEVDKLLEVAHEIESTTATNLLNEYTESKNINKLTSALEEIAYTIRTKAVISHKRNMSDTMKSYIDNVYKLLAAIKQNVDLNELDEIEIGLKQYAKLSHEAFNAINKIEAKQTDTKENNDKEKDKKIHFNLSNMIFKNDNKEEKENKTSKDSKDKKLSVVIADGLSNLLKKKDNIVLNKEKSKGKRLLVKPIVIAGCIIAVIIGSTIYSYSKNNSKDATPNGTKVSDLPDYKDISYDIMLGTLKLDKSTNDILNSLNQENREGGKDNSSSSTPEESTPTPAPTAEATKEPVETTEPTTTPAVSPTSAPTDVAKPTVAPTESPKPNIDNETIEIINSRASSIEANWSLFGEYDKETIVEVIKSINGLDSSMSINEADNIMLDVMNRATINGVKNAVAGEKLFDVYELNFTDLLLSDNGYTGVKAMELNLNGALVDQGNLGIYGTRALTTEAIIRNGGITGGLGIDSGSAGARLIWSRLVIGTNVIISSLGDDFSITVGEDVYTMSNLIDASFYESVVESAKQELSNNLVK